MINSAKILLLLSTLLVSQVDGFSVKPSQTANRRTFLSKAFIAAPAVIVGSATPLVANAAGGAGELVDDLKTSLQKMDPIPELLDQGEWDKVRTILKTPPVNKLWNLGDVSERNYIYDTGYCGIFEKIHVFGPCLNTALRMKKKTLSQIYVFHRFSHFSSQNTKTTYRVKTLYLNWRKKVVNLIC